MSKMSSLKSHVWKYSFDYSGCWGVESKQQICPAHVLVPFFTCMKKDVSFYKDIFDIGKSIVAHKKLGSGPIGSLAISKFKEK